MWFNLGWRRKRCLLGALLLLLLVGVTHQDANAQGAGNQKENTLYLPAISAGGAGLTALPGAAGDPATAAIPDLAFSLQEQDYAAGSPELGDLRISFNTLFLIFTLDTTVGEANAVLRQLGATIVGGKPGLAGQIEGILVLRLPTTTHSAMSAAIAWLRAQPKVKLAVQDSLLESPEPVTALPAADMRSVPKPNGGAPPGWTWQVIPAGDNWGLEMIRAPQLWNFNPAVTKTGTFAVTGVHDNGFSILHPDLVYLRDFNPLAMADHGSHVAGIIGAVCNNGVGVDGVNPFARLVVNRYGAGPGWSIFDFLEASPDLQVVNVSLGNNW